MKEGDIHPVAVTGGVLGLHCCEVKMVEGRNSTLAFLPMVPRFRAEIGGLYAFSTIEKGEAATGCFWDSLSDEEQKVFREGTYEDLIKLGPRTIGRLHALWAEADVKLVAPEAT